MALTAGDRRVSTPAGVGESASCQPASPFIKLPAQLAGAAADRSGRRSLPSECHATHSWSGSAGRNDRPVISKCIVG